MPTTEDLGKVIKKRYPGVYDEFSDAEVGRRVKERFPGKYDEYYEAPLTEKRTKEQVQKLIEHYNPNRGVFGTWLKRRKAKANVEYLKVLNEQEALIIEQGAMLERSILEGRARRVEFEVFVRQNAHLLHELRAKEVLIDQALERGFTLDSDQNVRLSEALTDVEVRRHRALKDVDLDVRWKEIVQDLDAADLLQIGEQQLVRKLTHHLTEMIREQHQIEEGNDPPRVKKALLKRYEKNIKNLEEQIDARQTRLALSSVQEEAKRLTAGEADSAGHYLTEDTADSEPAPAPKRGRGRPRKNPVN